MFGSSLYLYVYYEGLGYIRYPLLPGFFRMKTYVTDLIVGHKPSMLIETGLEPWLRMPIAKASLSDQYAHMDTARMQAILAFAKETSFSEQYLWGAEWWYYLKVKGDSHIWDMMKDVFAKS